MSATIQQLQNFISNHYLSGLDYVVGGSMAMHLLGYQIEPDDIDLHISDDVLEKLIANEVLYIKDNKIVNEKYNIDCGYVISSESCISWANEDYFKFSMLTNRIRHLDKEGLIWFYMDICKIKGFDTKWGKKLDILRDTPPCICLFR